jgi:hypothetical protein
MRHLALGQELDRVRLQQLGVGGQLLVGLFQVTGV